MTGLFSEQSIEMSLEEKVYILTTISGVLEVVLAHIRYLIIIC